MSVRTKKPKKIVDDGKTAKQIVAEVLAGKAKRESKTAAKLSRMVPPDDGDEGDHSGNKLVQTLSIKAPNFRVLRFTLVGTAPFVQNRFSQKAVEQIMATQRAGTVAKGKKIREPKDFDEVYKNAMHLSEDGRHGVPAGAFRQAMISACRTVGYKMTHAKLAVWVTSDFVDAKDGTPLVQIFGKPHQHIAHARNDNGGIDIRVRPMWNNWEIIVNVHFDADMFSKQDVIHLMQRVGQQVGLGEGRPDSRDSAGMGWGTFGFKTIEEINPKQRQ